MTYWGSEGFTRFVEGLDPQSPMTITQEAAGASSVALARSSDEFRSLRDEQCENCYE